MPDIIEDLCSAINQIQYALGLPSVQARIIRELPEWQDIKNLTVGELLEKTWKPAE